MKKLRGISLALLSIMTISLLIGSGQTLGVLSVVKQGSITVSKDDETVTITNEKVKIVFTIKGVKPVEWTDLATGLELAKNAQPAGAIGKRYPLWDWIPHGQEWPGEFCGPTSGKYGGKGTYGTNATSATYTGSVTISFNYTCTETAIAGLQIIKVLTFYQDKYYFDMTVILRNPKGAAISTAADWEPKRVGYNINAVGYLQPLSDLYQGYQDGMTPYLGVNKGWNRIDAKELKWVAVYNKGTGAIIALAILNATSTVWLEGGRGAWGSETRVEYLPVTIAPNSQVAYVLKVYGGPPDIPQLTEIDMSNLVAGVAFSAEMDSDRFVYLPGQICNYALNLTNGLAEPMTDVDVNVTFWLSNQYEALTTKVFNVKNWTDLTVPGKSTKTLADSLNLTLPPMVDKTRLNPKLGIYCLYAQVYKEKKPMTSLVLLIPIVEVPSTAIPLTTCFVWNLYQPYLLDSPTLTVAPSPELPGLPSAFLSTSIQDYVEKGNKPYLLHAQLLEKYTSINVTFNLQPTLLYSWNASANDKWWHWWWNSFTSYAHWEKGREEPSAACGEAIAKYKSLASSGRIELLASPYYHPIMPILLAKNWTSDLIDQLELGKNYTQTLMEVNPTGLWVPEMAFNMGLVPIINDTGLQYIVLDHRMLENATKLSAPSFEPWYVKDPKTNKTVVAFFRARFTESHWAHDYDICNRLATEFSTSGRPSEAARQFIACLFTIWLPAYTKSRIATVALDEWVSTGGPVADKTLENIYSALTKCSSWIKTKTLKSALKDVPPTKTVTNLQEGSWISTTGLNEWITPSIDFLHSSSPIHLTTKDALWNATASAREAVMKYAESLNATQRATNTTFRTALKYIYIAECSEWYKRADQAIGPATGYQHASAYADAVIALLSPPPPPKPPYVLYIVGGSLAAIVVVVASLIVYRRRRIKVARS